MKIAFAGAGDVGAYFLEEFSKSNYDIVLLTRAIKALPNNIKVEQQVTDYSVGNLTPILDECDVVLSFISAPDDDYVAKHQSLLEACRRSRKCKRLIPSEWTINVEDFHDQPTYIYKSRTAFREIIRCQNDVEWTIVCNGWFLDYLLPKPRRHLKDIGDGWVTNNEAKVFDIYGDGMQEISLTSVRDVAHVALRLIEQPAGSWQEYTHFAAQTMTYWDLFRLLQRRDPAWTTRHITLTDIVRSYTGEAPRFPGCELLMVMGFTRANRIRLDKALEWEKGVLAGLRARTVDQFLDEAERVTEGVL